MSETIKAYGTEAADTDLQQMEIERRAILNNLPEKDAPEIRQIAERIRKETTGSVRAGGGAKPPREQSEEERKESGEPREESGERRIPRRTREAIEKRAGGGAKPPKD